MPDYFDIACNFTSQEFINKTDAIIKESESHGVKKFLAVSSTISDFKTIAELRKSYPSKIFSSAGIHPHNATEVSGLDPSELEKEILFYKPNVIGETGLDYFRNLSPRDLQIQSFEFHIKIAIENALPLFLHQRDAHEDFVSVLKGFKSKLPKLVVHCFTGNENHLSDYLDLGAYIGVTGWICDYNRNQELLRSIKKIPLNKLMVETDCPYLLPKNLANKPKNRINLPQYLPHIVREISKLRNEDMIEIAHNAYQNSINFFS